MNYIQPDWPAPATIHAFTTTRLGWGSIGPYDAVKLPGSPESKQLTALLQLPDEPVWLKQTHSTHIVTADHAHLGQCADASFTSAPNRVCVVQTADCLPILICDEKGSQVAAIHAGWRGLAGGIIENTFQTLANPGTAYLVWLGPAIGPQAFEVGEDVFNAFTQFDQNAASAFTPHLPGKWLCNLYQLARQRLQRLGVGHIYGGDYCTYQQADWFYSYRRDKGLTGRMASVIWIS